MSTSLVVFNSGVSSTINPFTVPSDTRWMGFATSLNTAPVCFFIAPTAGKIRYLGFTYIPDDDTQKLQCTGSVTQFFIATIQIAKYDYDTGCHGPFTPGVINAGVDCKDYCSTNNIYFGENELKNEIDLVNKNDLVAISVTLAAGPPPVPFTQLPKTGKFSVTVGFTPNCTF